MLLFSILMNLLYQIPVDAIVEGRLGTEDKLSLYLLDIC